jgi:hypothetical protein
MQRIRTGDTEDDSFTHIPAAASALLGLSHFGDS